MNNDRRKCEFPECKNFGRNKGYYKGETRYDRFCEKHHRTRNSYYSGKQSIENKKCSVCGWNKAGCDRHRIDPKRGYLVENVISLCPNCHRLVGLGLLTVS